MKSIPLKIILFLAILPICRMYSQVIKYHYPTKRSESNRQFLNPSPKKNLKSVDYINKYIILRNLKTIDKSKVLLDSIVNICQPPFNNQKLVFNYDNCDRIGFYNEYLWYQSQWYLDSHDIFSYDSLGNISSQLMEFYGSLWYPYRRIQYSYDVKGNKISELNEEYIDSQWVNENQFISKYDSSGNLVEDLWMNWEGTGWINNLKVTYFIKNSVRDSLLFESWVSGKWINSNLAKPEYDNRGNLITMLWKSWNDSLWVNYLLAGFNYDLYGNMVGGLDENWDGSQWINSTRYKYIYNSGNYFTHGLTEIWQNSTWIPGDGEMDFKGFNRAFIGTDLSVFYQNTLSVDKISIPDGYSLSQNYPNPFNPTTIIRFTIPYDGLVQLRVFDILGREIATLVNEYRHKGNYEINYDARYLASGIYVYQIKCGTFTQSKIMVLQK
jgi:hypothetical protein